MTLSFEGGRRSPFGRNDNQAPNFYSGAFMSISSLANSIHLIRYLLVWRVNHSLIRLPSWLPVELSFVLGNIIAERLPTNQARPWRKALEAWHE